MTLQSSGAISLLNIQNEFKGTDESIESLTGVDKLQPSVWTDNTTPFPGRPETTGTATPSSKVTLTSSSTIETKTSYGSSTYSNTSNDNQLSEYSIPINEYYRNGIYVPDRDSSDTLVNQNVPTSGEISFANFYGGVNEDIILLINSNRVNLNLETAFNTESGSGSWTDKRRKRLIINTGVVIGGTSGNADKYALRIPENLIGGLIIINYGYIVGYGGLEGQNGGNGILVGATGPTFTTNAISSISHNLKFGIYGVVPQLTGLDNRYLTPIRPTTDLAGFTQLDTDFSIAHGTGEFSVGDSIYIYNKPTDLGSTGDLISDPSPSTEPLVNLCKISEKQTATFTAYISNGSLATAGNILSVISGTQPSIGMGIIKGTSYKKHIIVRTNTSSSSNVTFNGTKLLRADAGTFNLGMAIFGTDVEFGTIVTQHKSFFPPSTSYWGTISGTTFTVTATPTEPILPGYYLTGSLFTQETVYIVEQLSGTPGKVGTYRVNVDASGSNITSYAYIILNKSQTITGPVSVTGIRHVLNDDPFDGISTENEINTNFGNGRSMTAVRYILDRNVNTSLDLQNKSSNFKFFTAGGTTSPGFTVTTTQVNPITGSTALSALTEGQSVTISGSTATATGTNTTTINTLIFNGTWNNIDKLNDTQFFVATTKIDNTYSTVTGGGGTFPTSTTAPFTVPIKILNYGFIYGGGGGGSNSVATKNFGIQRNYLANQYDGTSTGNLSSSSSINGKSNNVLACKIQLNMDPGFNGVGGVGQGYDQAKTLGTAGTPDPNAKRYAYMLCFGDAATWTIAVDPYFDLISIPPNTEVNLFLTSLMKGPAQVTWKDVYFGSGSTPGSQKYGTITASGTIRANNGFFIGGSQYGIRIDNLYTFGSNNTLLFETDTGYIVQDRIINTLYRLSTQTAPTFVPSLTRASPAWSLGNTITTPQTNPYPTDQVRIITTTNKFTYDITFPDQNVAPKAGDGGDYGSSGSSASLRSIAPGFGGYYISNSFVYSNVTWVNRGDFKGRES
jgi:hypothetical protein